MDLKDADPIRKVGYAHGKPREQLNQKMPYKSEQQRKFFHSAGAVQAGISPDTVNEFDSASAGMALPTKAPKAHRALPPPMKERVAVRRALQGKRSDKK